MCLSTQLPAQTTDSGSVAMDEVWGDPSGFLLSVYCLFLASSALPSKLQCVVGSWEDGILMVAFQPSGGKGCGVPRVLDQ